MDVAPNTEAEKVEGVAKDGAKVLINLSTS